MNREVFQEDIEDRSCAVNLGCHPVQGGNVFPNSFAFICLSSELEHAFALHLFAEVNY